MKHFLDTQETIGKGFGFPHFGRQHLGWLAAFVAVTVFFCKRYKTFDERRRKRWRRWAAFCLLLNEVFKTVMLLLRGNYRPKYLPLHLCSVNIFLIAAHAWKPFKLLGNFLYLVCIPGAIAALLFPIWSTLPAWNFMYLHSFTVHIQLAMYPIVLTAGGDIRPWVRDFPKCFLLLLGMALPISWVNRRFGTNFMFLSEPEEGTPLMWFHEKWGNHLLGYPPMIAAVMAVMAVPVGLLERLRRNADLNP